MEELVRTEVLSPRGRPATWSTRSGTTDLATVGSTWELWGIKDDEYGLTDIVSDGLMIDVGAHIGTVCLAFLYDNPAATAVAIEPLPENVEMLWLNAEGLGVADRLTVRQGAIGATQVNYGPDIHRYIANIRGSDGGALTVEEIALPLSADVMKLDCEGCEYSALTADLSGIRLIFGEYHNGTADLLPLLSRTHDVTVSGGGGVGAFRAERKPERDFLDANPPPAKPKRVRRATK